MSFAEQKLQYTFCYILFSKTFKGKGFRAPLGYIPGQNWGMTDVHKKQGVERPFLCNISPLAMIFRSFS